jgi:hypothetical protein
MPKRYTMVSKFSAKAEISDRVLSVTDDQSRRLILRSEVIHNGSNPEAGVKIKLRYQRKRKNDQWEDVSVDGLSVVKTNEEVQLIFDSQQTLELKFAMDELYAVKEKMGIIPGVTRLVVGREDEVILTNENRARTIKALLEQNYAEELWESLLETNPDLATRLSVRVNLRNSGKRFLQRTTGFSVMA